MSEWPLTVSLLYLVCFSSAAGGGNAKACLIHPLTPPLLSLDAPPIAYFLAGSSYRKQDEWRVFPLAKNMVDPAMTIRMHG